MAVALCFFTVDPAGVGAVPGESEAGEMVVCLNSDVKRIFPPHFGERRTISEGYLHFLPIM